MMMESINH